MIPDNGIITRDTPEYRILQDMLRHVERIADTLMTEVAPALSGERYLTTEQVMSQLHISRRALQTYRDKGLIPYTSLGKVLLYPESKINEVLERNYYDPMRYFSYRAGLMTGSKFYAVFSFENLHLHNLLFFPIFVVVLKIR